MKKLKLKALELGAREVLNREQLKNVLGGFDDGSGSGGGAGSGKCRNSCQGKGGGLVLCDLKPVGAGTFNCVCPTNSAYRCA